MRNPLGSHSCRTKIVRSLSCMIVLALLVSVWTVSPIYAGLLQGEPAVTANAAILVEQASGKVLFGKAADSRMYPASLTKLLTALIVVTEGGNLDTTVQVGDEVNLVKANSSVAGLLAGDQISLRDLIYGILLPSGNDAAYAAAVYTARIRLADPTLPIDRALDSFLQLMNQKATELGATHSKFINPDGYHSPEHYSTASDLALIARQVMDQEFLKLVVSRENQTVSYLRQGKRVYRNWSSSNKLLNRHDPVYYRYATGLKTGTTLEAGHCLASAASTGQLNLIAIVLDSNAEGRWQDSRQLLEYGFQQYQYQELCRTGDPQVTARVASRFPGLFASSRIISSQTVGVPIRREDIERIVRSYSWQRAFATGQGSQVTVRAGVAAGTEVGRLIYTLDQQTLADVPLALGGDALHYRPSAALVLAPVVTLLLVILVRQRRRHQQRRPTKAKHQSR